MERILNRIAKRIGEKDLKFILEAAVVLYRKMMYGDWGKKG